jgi:nitrite reductase (NADH) small subunit
MAMEQSIGTVDQIPKGEGRTFELGELRIAVFHTRAGEVFACQAVCPHRDGPLSDGILGGATLVCPLHDRSFDLRTGCGIGHDDCVKVFPARLAKNGFVLITA